MCAVFGRKYYDLIFYDGITLSDGFEDRNFTVRVVRNERNASESIQGGRIVEFLLYDGDSEVLCNFNHGKWEMELDPNDGMAQFALSHFVTMYNLPHVPCRTAASLRYIDALGEFNRPANSVVTVPKKYSREKHIA